MKNVFIDGSAGTTGLRIYERLQNRADIRLITLPEDRRKEPAARKDALNSADIAFLCLPDEAAKEAVGMIDNPDTAVIDTSTAHRTNDGFIYGFPELTGQRERLRGAKRVANPGCHASGFIALVRPLIEAGILPADTPLSCVSLTGYSGGGKKMIAQYEASDRDPLLEAPRLYALAQTHKHLPEIVKLCRLKTAPVFCPIVADYYAGMETVIPIFPAALGVTRDTIADCYRSYYAQGLVRFREENETGGFLSAAVYAGRDDMEIYLCGNAERLTLTARFDNLGKGASGAAIQNMNILLDTDETTGLNV